jgi:hypothetical protein
MTDVLKLPSEERVRELTADPRLTPDQASQQGDLFARAGKLPQAMMFYERSRDVGRLSQVKEKAIQMGDAFLLHWITRLAPELVKEGEWKDAGERALADGKFLFARDCFEKAGDEAKAQSARDAWLKIFPDPATSARPTA